MKTVPAMAAFDVCGPLPTGVTVLEASAGTGKTFTIAALATRFVAEGVVPLEHLLVVTFTRMATGELRQRVRERLVSAEEGLTRALAGVAPDPADEVLVLLSSAPANEVEARRDRLRAALSDFDAATIDTTHGFCSRVLDGLGITGDVSRDAVFVEDTRDHVDEVVEDFYLRKFVDRGDPPFTVDAARRIARQVVSNPDAVLYPADAVDGSDEDLRCRFAAKVREEVDRRRRQAGVLTYDDLLTRLRDTLADERRGALACQRLRERYRVALVDEFQDTDPVQWEIMRRAFVVDGADATLVLIGDPKQAIYSFRGADVYAYLDAASVAGERATLQVNWRSDQGLLDGFDALFDGGLLGHEGISYREARAAEGNQGRRLAGAPVDEPLRVRLIHREDELAKRTPKGYLAVGGAREVVVADLAGDIAGLLSSGAKIPSAPIEGGSGTVTVQPRHIAVLVQRNRDALAVCDALDGAGVPAVVNGAGSVLATTGARQWLRLLEALERPTVTNPVRAVALTPFLGWTPEQVATAADAEWEALHARLHRWAAVLRRRGVAALLETINRRQGLARRVLSRPRGERELTDIRHVGQVLHAVETAEQLGVTALVAWLHDAMEDADEEVDVEDRSRRLESDAEAVQVLTVFRSKGLEFPVVYCPFLWDPGHIVTADPPVFHDPAAGDRRAIDVSGDRNGPSAAQQLVEKRGEELRLAYVALTRAKHQVVLWWAPTWDSRDSSLCRLLFHRDEAGNVRPDGGKPPTDAEAVERFHALGERAPGRVSVERVGGGGGAVWAPAEPTVASLSARPFDRALDPHWRRTSYSAITSTAHETMVASEAEEPVVSDEVLPAGGLGPDSGPGEGAGAEVDGRAAALRAMPSLLATMRGGADVGTFVHGVLEAIDFATTDLDAELEAAFAAEDARRGTDVGDPGVVVAGLRAALETPLGPLVGGLRLRDVGRRDRIDELAFELPLVGGDAPTATLAVDQIARLLSEHLGPDDVLAGYADRLGDPGLQTDLRGYLAGSLDLVLRTPEGRFGVVDYKTNWLGGADEDLSAWHYRPAALTDAMVRAHYPLQALLYTVALHRYLRWRLPGYDCDRHLAGVLYLFVRGMVGADTPVVDGGTCGVFAWRPPASLVVALSDLFDTGEVTP